MTEADLTDLLLPDDLPPDHRSGFVAVLGQPNVGKSTLMNAILGEKIAIVSPKPQTTRNRLLGILTREDAQVVFMDTPGIHQPLHKLGEYMVETAVRTIPDADLALFLVDVSRPPSAEDQQIARLLNVQEELLALLVLNKADLLSPGSDGYALAYQALVPEAPTHLISALKGHGLDELLEKVIASLPAGPRYFPEDQLTDQQLRFIAAELIREAVLTLTHQEVPHAVAVRVEEFKERSPTLTYISANIFVERGTQKGIVLGEGGRMIKRIGASARREIEQLLGTKVYLELWVKIKKKWRKDEAELRRLGYVVPPKG